MDLGCDNYYNLTAGKFRTTCEFTPESTVECPDCASDTRVGTSGQKNPPCSNLRSRGRHWINSQFRQQHGPVIRYRSCRQGVRGRAALPTPHSNERIPSKTPLATVQNPLSEFSKDPWTIVQDTADDDWGEMLTRNPDDTSRAFG